MNERRIDDLERQLKSAQSDLNRLPMRIPPLSPNPYDLGYVGGGNSIDPSGYVGIKKILTTLATLAAVYDPTAFPATANGVGWGWHFRLSKWVLMLNDLRSGIAHDLPTNAPVFISAQPVVLWDAGNTAQQDCYVIALT